MKKIAIITGASSGIGAATALAMHQRWPDLHFWLLARRKDRLDSIASKLKDRATTFQIDVRDRAAVEFFAAKNDLSKVSILVNNAGLAAGLDLFQDASIDDWEQMIDTNVKGLLYMTRMVLPHMIKNGTGHIVNMGSIAGHEIYPKGHVYNATKFAVHALNSALRLDTLGTGIRVTSIDPGMVDTEFSLVRFKGDEKKAESVYTGLKPLSAEDVAEAIVWSLDRPAHVNVQEILLMPTAQASVRDVFRKNS